jgi:hypothetical protein
VIVSGDLTRDGLFDQFVPVVDFLRGIGMGRVLAIPGNRDYLGAGPARPADSDLHYFLTAPDTPELDPLRRSTAMGATPFLDFFDDINFFERRQGVTLVGLDSEPAISEESFAQAMAFFDSSSSGTVRVFCTHRSLLPVPRKKLKEGDVLVNAGDLLAQLVAAHVDLVLCAHLHRVNVWQLSDGAHTMAIVNAPSLLDRSPGKENGLLAIDVGRRGELLVTLYPLDGAAPRWLLETSPARKRGKRAA